MEGTKQDIPGDCGGDGLPVGAIRIVFASDCKPCPDCGEPFCLVCGEHYADCGCPGPSNADELGLELVEVGGVLYGVKR